MCTNSRALNESSYFIYVQYTYIHTYKALSSPVASGNYSVAAWRISLITTGKAGDLVMMNKAYRENGMQSDMHNVVLVPGSPEDRHRIL